jgi:hypothetical protein
MNDRLLAITTYDMEPNQTAGARLFCAANGGFFDILLLLLGNISSLQLLSSCSWLIIADDMAQGKKYSGSIWFPLNHKSNMVAG